MSQRLIVAAAALALSTGAALAIQSDVSMKSTLSPDAMWKKVGNFCGIGNWLPILAKCELSADGKQRMLTTKDGAVVTEREESRDDASHSYQYTIIGGPLPVANYHSVISVKADGTGSLVSWAGKYDAKGASDADAKKVIDSIYDAGVKGLVQP